MIKRLYLLILILAIFSPVAARAEGSKELTANEGQRPYLDDRGDSFNTIPRSNLIKVYVEAGEVLELGSSAIGTGGANIIATPPTGTGLNCTTDRPGNGFIANRNQEVAGPGDGTGNTFVPCSITVGSGQTGIWEIQFISPNSGGTQNPTTRNANVNWPAPTTNDSFVAAWDVTVRNGGTVQTGRAFANSLALNTNLANINNLPNINSRAFVQTQDGYRYQINLNGLQPVGFIFFANQNGFTDSSGNPTYRSVDATNNSNRLTDDPTNDNFTHKLFLNTPASILPPTANAPGGTNTWLNPATVVPQAPSSLTFFGRENTENQTGTNPLQGNFQFDAPEVRPFTISIDVDQNDSFTDPIDRIIIGTAQVGTNTVAWDGKDGNGNDVPPSSVGYRAQVKLYAGQVHFPLIDPERNPNGLIINRLTPISSVAGDPTYDSDWMYYDDSDFFDPNNGVEPNPISLLTGGSSSVGIHNFEGNFIAADTVNSADQPNAWWGNRRGIDTWALVPSQPVELNGRIVVLQADLEIAKTLTTTNLIAGGEISYTITVTNNGPSNVTGATVTDTFPTQIVNATWTCAITTGTGACTAASGSGDINTTVDLESGAVATFTVTAGLTSNATVPITNSATVTRPNDVSDPTDQDGSGGDNTTETATANFTGTISPGDPVLGIAKAAGTVTANSDGSFSIPYTLVVSNTGNVSFNNVQVTENLSSTFGDSTFTIESRSATNLTINNNFDGDSDTNLLAGSATLAASASGTITFTVRVTPRNNLPAYTNTAQVSGTTPGGTTVTDDSTNGSDPDPDGDGNPTNNSDPTVVTFDVPRLGVAKAAGTPVDNNNGTYTIPYTLVVSNSGTVDINNLQVTDNLSTRFSGITFSIQSISSNDVTVNSSFNGSSDTNLLAGTDTLAVNATAEITFNVLITPAGNIGPFENTAIANGTSPDGTSVSDDSTNGSNSDPDGDGDPTNNAVPTVVSLGESPSVGLAKLAGTVTNNNDGTFTIPYTLRVNNDGNVNLSNFQVTDNLSTTFGTVPFSVQSISSPDGLTVNSSFNGSSDTNLLAGTDTLAVNTTAEITFNVLITPGTNAGPFDNTAIANGTSPDGTSVSDDSTNGSNSDPDGDGDPTNNAVPTSVTVSISTTTNGTPNVRLVKRVTRVNNTPFNNAIDDPNDANDDASLNWPSSYLQGEIDVPDILPGDEVEYTIYFLSDGSVPANNVRICDLIPENQTFLETAFNGLTQASGGFVGVDRGSAIAFGTADSRSHTNANDNDLARFFSPGTQITSPPCSTANNSNGAIIWDLGNVTNFSADANNSFGFVRFRAIVD